MLLAKVDEDRSVSGNYLMSLKYVRKLIEGTIAWTVEMRLSFYGFSLCLVTFSTAEYNVTLYLKGFSLSDNYSIRISLVFSSYIYHRVLILQNSCNVHGNVKLLFWCSIKPRGFVEQYFLQWIGDCWCPQFHIQLLAMHQSFPTPKQYFLKFAIPQWRANSAAKCCHTSFLPDVLFRPTPVLLFRTHESHNPSTLRGLWGSSNWFKLYSWGGSGSVISVYRSDTVQKTKAQLQQSSEGYSRTLHRDHIQTDDLPTKRDGNLVAVSLRHLR